MSLGIEAKEQVRVNGNWLAVDRIRCARCSAGEWIHQCETKLHPRHVLRDWAWQEKENSDA